MSNNDYYLEILEEQMFESPNYKKFQKRKNSELSESYKVLEEQLGPMESVESSKTLDKQQVEIFFKKMKKTLDK